MSYYRKKLIRQQIEDAALMTLMIVGALLCVVGTFNPDPQESKLAWVAGVGCMFISWICFARITRSWPFAKK